ncbi:MAG: response regulator transcription factor [Vampirovibrionales bacterium]|nr:response regulator transcription factor [Vampirovibrionales bacterium]
MKEPVKVILVEDHELTREGLAFGLGKFPEIKLLATAENGEEAIALIGSLCPNLVLVDIIMPVLNGIQATREIKANYPDTKIIMLTSHREQDKVFDAFSAGADGYCLKDVKTEKLVKIIEMVMEGAFWLDPAIAGLILKVLPLISESVSKVESRNRDLSQLDLTYREKEILSLIASGLNNKDIAEKLTISLYTVKNHFSNIIQKMAVDDRTQAAILALKQGII